MSPGQGGELLGREVIPSEDPALHGIALVVPLGQFSSKVILLCLYCDTDSAVLKSRTFGRPGGSGCLQPNSLGLPVGSPSGRRNRRTGGRPSRWA